ncbi:DUF6366 family protein [Desertibacillus haloalkaliphilus]|uniref:DUF6366 family protein n=1 Tax=Desertibacillus haloalkaliphilus TaxID=1328930 RepID=UPI0028B04C86|nr:DUF6366 family protein [Desertibacillus haloalkaliphilus]
MKRSSSGNLGDGINRTSVSNLWDIFGNLNWKITGVIVVVLVIILIIKVLFN